MNECMRVDDKSSRTRMAKQKEESTPSTRKRRAALKAPIRFHWSELFEVLEEFLWKRVRQNRGQAFSFSDILNFKSNYDVTYPRLFDFKIADAFSCQWGKILLAERVIAIVLLLLRVPTLLSSLPPPSGILCRDYDRTHNRKNPGANYVAVDAVIGSPAWKLRFLFRFNCFVVLKEF